MLDKDVSFWIGGDETFIDLLYILNPLNIETRYPEYRDKIYRSLTKNRLKEILIKTEEIQAWIKKKLLEK